MQMKWEWFFNYLHGYVVWKAGFGILCSVPVLPKSQGWECVQAEVRPGLGQEAWLGLASSTLGALASGFQMLSAVPGLPSSQVWSRNWDRAWEAQLLWAGESSWTDSPGRTEEQGDSHSSRPPPRPGTPAAQQQWGLSSKGQSGAAIEKWNACVCAAWEAGGCRRIRSHLLVFYWRSYAKVKKALVLRETPNPELGFRLPGPTRALPFTRALPVTNGLDSAPGCPARLWYHPRSFPFLPVMQSQGWGFLPSPRPPHPEFRVPKLLGHSPSCSANETGGWARQGWHWLCDKPPPPTPSSTWGWPGPKAILCW